MDSIALDYRGKMRRCECGGISLKRQMSRDFGGRRKRFGILPDSEISRV